MVNLQCNEFRSDSMLLNQFLYFLFRDVTWVHKRNVLYCSRTSRGTRITRSQVLVIISVEITIIKQILKFHLFLHSTCHTQSFGSSYVGVSIEACTWRLPVLPYPHVIKSGWGESTRVEKQ